MLNSMFFNQMEFSNFTEIQTLVQIYVTFHFFNQIEFSNFTEIQGVRLIFPLRMCIHGCQINSCLCKSPIFYYWKEREKHTAPAVQYIDSISLRSNIAL